MYAKQYKTEYRKYDSSQEDTPEVEIYQGPANTWNVWNYKKFTDKAHGSLERCCECQLKFDISKLVKVTDGKLMCKFCMKGAV